MLNVITFFAQVGIESAIVAFGCSFDKNIFFEIILETVFLFNEMFLYMKLSFIYRIKL